MSADFDGAAGGRSPVETSTTTLVSEILADLHHLAEQQIELSKRQVVGEFRRLKPELAIFVGGMVALLVDAFTFCLMLVHLLHWLALPSGATDVSRLPLWVCFGIVAILLLVVGLMMIRRGQTQFARSLERGMRSPLLSATESNDHRTD